MKIPFSRSRKRERENDGAFNELLAQVGKRSHLAKHIFN